jgi:predicted transcriptional regulator
MGRRRGEVQIMTDILSVSLEGARFTHLMYRANLSYATLRRYLLAALDRDLICKATNGEGTVVYRITEKGKTLLKQLRNVEINLDL